MNVVGQFRDANNLDRFVWIRGFGDMPARGVALKSSYGGPVWHAHLALVRLSQHFRPEMRAEWRSM